MYIQAFPKEIAIESYFHEWYGRVEYLVDN
jgi:hypothetical protein